MKKCLYFTLSLICTTILILTFFNELLHIFFSKHHKPDNYKKFSVEEDEGDIALITRIIKEFDEIEYNEIRFILEMLTKIESLVHNIDNALSFINQGGLEKVISPCIVMEMNSNIRSHVMRILGVVLKNNPTAQLRAFRNNFGSHINDIIMSSKSESELSAAISALGSLLRHNPEIQRAIFSTFGVAAIKSVTLTPACNLRINSEALMVINDVLKEKAEALEYMVENPERAAKYAGLHYDEWLLEYSFCDVFSTAYYDFKGFYKFDRTILEFIAAMEYLLPYCSTIWSQSTEVSEFLNTVHKLDIGNSNSYVHRIVEDLYHTEL